MAVQKVAYDGHTLIDLTQDTAVESDVADGKWFHKSNGERVQGTSGKVIVQGSDSSAYLIRPTAGETLAPLDCDRKSVLKKLGNTVCVNQVVKHGNFDATTDWSALGGTIAVSNNKLTFTRTTVSDSARIQQSIPIISGHKYLISQTITPSSNIKYEVAYNTSPISRLPYVDVTANVKTPISSIFTASGNATILYFYNDRNAAGSVSDTVIYENVFCIDLTLWFGSNDRIPSDLLSHPENWSRYYAGSLDYNAGTLESADGTVMRSVGRNVWDEEWEVGSISASTGENEAGNTTWRTKNYIPLVLNTPYYVYAVTDKNLRARFYDAQKNYIGYSSGSGTTVRSTTPFTPPANAAYMRLAPLISDIPTPNHDITISLYYSGEPGYDTYYPYSVLAEVDMGSEVLRSAGAVADEKTPDGTITRRVGVVDLGTLTWNKTTSGTYNRFYSTGIASLVLAPTTSVITANISCAKYIADTFDRVYRGTGSDRTIAITDVGSGAHGNINILDNSFSDAAAFKTAMSGVYLYYELTTPTTEQGTAFTGLQKVDGHGIEMVTGGTTGIPIPFTAQYLKTINAAPTDTIVITENGSHDVSMYAEALVEVSGGGTPSLQSKTVNLDSNAPSTVYPGTGYNGLSSVSFNTAGINAANIKAGTSVCGVLGTAEAEFHHSVTLSIKFVNNRGNTKRIYYMDRDVNDVTKVIWTSQPINADGVAHTVTFPVVATPVAGGTVRPIIYVDGWDGAAISDVTTASGIVPYSVEMDDTQGTGSEMFVFGVVSTTATLVIDNNY